MEHKCKFDPVVSAMFLLLTGLITMLIGLLADSLDVIRSGLDVIFVALALFIGRFSAELRYDEENLP